MHCALYLLDPHPIASRSTSPLQGEEIAAVGRLTNHKQAS